ncbi:MAG: manno-octulosonate cytidylyltransferase [Bdellovibrionales bacterium]|jgi:3-deoxy-manno-octulosonate cytidylyltransferase (CMP-KDO synthetase)
MNTLIIIPARYGSTRLPGKPLAMIAGQTLLSRVVRCARAAVREEPSRASFVVATDDERIGRHAEEIGAPWVMTPATCATGTDRAREAFIKMKSEADFIINLQGDSPFTPPAFLTAMIRSFSGQPCDLVTPVVQMTWAQLDQLREEKKTTPFTGTTALFDEKTGRAHWFSKNILPAIRKEVALREASILSPVWRHIGLYGYSRMMLGLFAGLPEGRYEALEGLEQLRVIENGYTIRCVPVQTGGDKFMSGIDSPEDIVRAEALIAAQGEPFSD